MWSTLPVVCAAFSGDSTPTCDVTLARGGDILPKLVMPVLPTNRRDEMGTTPLVISGLIQGMGIGFTFVPLSAVTFATLAPQLRNAGTPLYSLLRNLGGSVGISIVQALQSQGAARSHSELVESVTWGHPGLSTLPSFLAIDQPTGLAWLNTEVTRQASMISYLQVFGDMLLLCLAAMPFLLLIRVHRNTTTTSTTSPTNAPNVTEPAH